MNTEAMTATCPVAARRNVMPIERGFDAYIASVFQRFVDKAVDKDDLIDWLSDQLEAWETQAEREAERGPEVLWEGGPVRSFPADDVVRWIEQTLDRLAA